MSRLTRRAALGAAAALLAAPAIASAADRGRVRAVTTDPALETVFVNMHAAGVGITLKKR